VKERAERFPLLPNGRSAPVRDVEDIRVMAPTPEGTLMEVTPADTTVDPIWLRLTDELREHLIEALGGYVRPPRVHLAQPPGDVDGLRVFTDEDQRDTYAELVPGAITGSTHLLDGVAADQLIAETSRAAKDQENRTGR
jgi:hypothetical protein